jgi:hypothetical protein
MRRYLRFEHDRPGERIRPTASRKIGRVTAFHPPKTTLCNKRPGKRAKRVISTRAIVSIDIIRP